MLAENFRGKSFHVYGLDLPIKIQDRGQQLFALAGILAFTDKLVDRETASRIRRAIEMTQVAQIFEEYPKSLNSNSN